VGRKQLKTAPYKFTTLAINFGEKNGTQFFDLPGLLGREKLNKVEKRSMAALKNLNAKIIFIFDPTQKIAPQKKLLEKVKEINPNITILYSKEDIANEEEKERIESLKKEYNAKSTFEFVEEFTSKPS
jgi:GTP1/Obg family GTP-binding protein